MTIENRPLPGQIVELAMWLSGEETEDHLRRFREEDMPREFKSIADHWLLLLGPLQFTIKRPGGHRVPPVPPHIHGTDVQLIVVEAEVLKWKKPTTSSAGFIADLRPDDLQTLRRATRRQHARTHPGMPPLPDENCDAVIEEMGPEAAVAELRRAAGATLQ